MEGFVVKSQTVRDGEHWLLVETMEPSRWCPSCGVAGVGNGRRRVVVRDLPIAGVPTVLVWDKRTFRCRERLCERGSWSETSPLIAPRASLTERARAEICRRPDVHRPLVVMAVIGLVALNFETTFPSMVRFGFDR